MAWTEVGENSGAWVCEYYAHTFGVPANAMAFRLSGEDLAVISPPADTSDAAFAEIDKLGRVTAIVDTSDYSNLGVADWRARYSDAGVFAPVIRTNRMYAKMVVKDSRAIAAAALEALEGDPIIVPAHELVQATAR